MKDLEKAQVFTPEWATNQMIDLLDPSCLATHETFFFEPTCGDGQMLVVIIERIFQALLVKYEGDKDKALADTLHKFYAIELDDRLVPLARMRIWEWAINKLEREPTVFEQCTIAHGLQQSIENRNFFDVIKSPVLDNPKARAVSRKIKAATE